jgi:hypothetical protein
VIILKPFGGLCNRLRLIASGLTLARDIGTSARVIWKTGPDMVARFEDLLEPIAGVTVIGNGRYRFVQSPHSCPRPAAPVVTALNRALGVRHAYFETDIPMIWEGRVDLRTVPADETILLCTCQSLEPAADLDFGWVTPQPAIAARIATLRAGRQRSRAIGVHVRRTDHVESTRDSPLDLFVSRIEAEQAADGGVQVFLATDDPAVERTLVDRFGSGTVQTRPKRFGRDSVEAIQDAVVDLFALAGTSRILATAASSFSETAAAIGGIPLTILRRET